MPEMRWAKFLDQPPEATVPYVPVVIQGFDRRPVEKTDEAHFVGKTPELFAQQLQKAKAFVDDHSSMQLPSSTGGQRMVVIYAWNEIGEGGILIPNKDEGDTYLQQVGEVFE
jgi:hypothetical protein